MCNQEDKQSMIYAIAIVCVPVTLYCLDYIVACECAGRWLTVPSWLARRREIKIAEKKRKRTTP